MIEKGRHYNILLDDRNCVYCESCLEDEFHFVMICPLYHDLRLKYFEDYFLQDVHYTKFCTILSSENTTTIRNLAMYLFYAFEMRSIFLNGRE